MTKDNTKEYPTQIDLVDGKYTLIFDLKNGRSECLRYGEPWRQLSGDKLILACFDRIVELSDRIEQLEAERDELKSIIALYDKALKASWPEGARGEAFDHWNAARKIIAKGEKE